MSIIPGFAHRLAMLGKVPLYELYYFLDNEFIIFHYTQVCPARGRFIQTHHKTPTKIQQFEIIKIAKESGLIVGSTIIDQRNGVFGMNQGSGMEIANANKI